MEEGPQLCKPFFPPTAVVSNHVGKQRFQQTNKQMSDKTVALPRVGSPRPSPRGPLRSGSQGSAESRGRSTHTTPSSRPIDQSLRRPERSPRRSTKGRRRRPILAAHHDASSLKTETTVATRVQASLKASKPDPLLTPARGLRTPGRPA